MLIRIGLIALALSGGGQEEGLRKALTFHASFDGKADADFALGDPKVYTTSTASLRDARPGITIPEIAIAAGQGKYGDALRWSKKVKPVLVYRADRNVAYDPRNFRGTVSFWLSLDPEKDLEPGYCDPLQLTDKKWDDACFFVDFSKDEVPRLFRLGVFADFKEWNPTKRKFDSIPDAERPMVVDRRHPFGKDRWTHVAFTFDGFNCGEETSVARFYLNGEFKGELKGKRTISWDLSKAFILLGYNYVGLYDDLAVFNRPLTADEIKKIGELKGGIRSLP